MKPIPRPSSFNHSVPGCPINWTSTGDRTLLSKPGAQGQAPGRDGGLETITEKQNDAGRVRSAET